tara:strand:+ start:349 stop:531 length:183 start_codon:yes stop_codon:yes gene_type:complete
MYEGRKLMSEDKRTVKEAIEFQIGMIGLAQQTGRDDLLKTSVRRLDTLLKQIPGDLFVKD